MTAEKANKVYVIAEGQTEEYRTAGYDIYDDDGKIVSYGAGKSVPYEEYAKTCTENRELKEALEKYQKIETEGIPEQTVKATAKKKASE